jgi:hypothetical protein
MVKYPLSNRKTPSKIINTDQNNGLVGRHAIRYDPIIMTRTNAARGTANKAPVTKEETYVALAPNRTVMRQECRRQE